MNGIDQPAAKLGFLSNLKWWQATVMIAVILVAAGWAASQGVNVSVNVDVQARVEAIEKRLDIPVNSSLSAFLKSNTYIISTVDAYATLLNGTNGKLVEYLTNQSQVFMDGLNNASPLGGSVYVFADAYSAAVIVPNNVRFVIDKGATGINYTVASGANCIVDDFNGGIFQYYSNGLPYSVFNYANGILLTQSANLTTIYVNTITSLSGNLQIFKLVVESGSSFPANPAAGYLFYENVSNVLFCYNSTNWVACSSGGSGGADDDSAYLLSSSATNFLFQNGTRALTADWNIGAYGIYGLTWFNSTSINVANYYLGNQSLGFVEPSAFTIDVSGSNYRAWYGANSTLAFQSTSESATINNAMGNLTSSRTWKEKIVVKGNLTVDGNVNVASYSVLDLTAANFVLKSSLNTNVYAFYLHNINDADIIGGYIDGNQANQASGTNYGIYILGDSANCTVSGVTVKSFRTDGIRSTNDLGNNKIVGNFISNCTTNGIVLSSSDGDTISGNSLFGNQRGIYLSTASNNTITENTIYANTVYGIYGNAGSNGNSITANTLNNNYYGISVTSSNYNAISGNVIDGLSRSLSQFGINVAIGSLHNSIAGNTVQNVNYSIRMDSAANFTQVNANTVNNSWVGIEAYNASDGCTIADNNIFYSLSHGLWVYMSSYSDVHDNRIYYSSQSTNNSYDALRVSQTGGSSGDNVPAQYNKIHDNIINEDPTQNRSRRGIFEDSGGNYNDFSKNDIYNELIPIELYGAATTYTPGNDGVYSITHMLSTTASGGAGTVNGTGALARTPVWERLTTGTTSGSMANEGHFFYGFNNGSYTYNLVDFTLRMELDFDLERDASDVNATAHLQIRNDQTYGNLTAKGFGLLINNFTVYGEAYGSAQQTLFLVTMTSSSFYHFHIVLRPSVGIDFWVNNVLIGTIGGTGVPTGQLVTDSFLMIGLMNGVTSSTSCIMRLENLIVKQYWTTYPW